VLARFRRERHGPPAGSPPQHRRDLRLREEKATSFIAMEYVEGRRSQTAFEGHERFANAEIVRIMSRSLDALGYSHRQGVVHRRHQARQRLLLEDGTVKVADSASPTSSRRAHASGSVMGTPSFFMVAPSRSRGCR